jgi:hypothetical protein
MRNTGRSPTARRTGQGDPFLPFKISPMNGGKREKAIFGCRRGLRQERAVHLSRWAEAAEARLRKILLSPYPYLSAIRSTERRGQATGREAVRRKYGPGRKNLKSGCPVGIHGSPQSLVGLFQIDRLIMAGLVQLRPRHLMRTLVVVWTESDRGTQSQIEITHSLKVLDEFFCVNIAADPLDSLGENAGLDVTLERNVIRRLTGKILSKRFFIF